MAKITTVSGTHFAAEFSDGQWQLRRKLTERTAGEVMGMVTHTQADEYHCAEAEFSFEEDLSDAEAAEALSMVFGRIASNEDIVYLRVAPESMSDTLRGKLGVISDPISAEWLLWECPESRITPLMAVGGLAVGMCIGMAIGAAKGNIGPGMNAGILLGLATGSAVGSLLSVSRHKKREELKNARIDSFLKSDGTA